MPSGTEPPNSPWTDALDVIRVRSLTWRDATLAERRDLLTPPGDGDPDVDERVVLETCHRVEIVTVGDADGPDRGALTSGRDAVRRVFEVAAGFDSAVVAEEQLLGQVRAAYESALASGATGPILNELFRRALRFGRRVRSHATPGTDRSLADPAATWILERLGPGRPALVAGTGEMGRLVALRLASAGHPLTIVSRSAERGRRMLETLTGSGHRLSVGALSAPTIARHDALVLAVRSSTPLVDAVDLVGVPGPWTLDLSAPPAVAAAAAAALGERYLDVDRLGSATTLAPVLTPAVERRLRTELEAEVDAFAAWLGARHGADAIALLRDEADAIRRRHLDRVRRRAALTAEQLAVVEAATAGMVGELLHRPSVTLRRGGPDAEAIRRLLGFDR